MGRTVGLPFVVLGLVASTLSFTATAADAQPAPPPTRPLTASVCSSVDADGNQVCSSDSGVLQLVAGPDGTLTPRLGLTSVRELRRHGAVVYRGEEQHSDLDLTRSGAAAAGAPSRRGIVVADDGAQCTFDDRAVLAASVLRRELSNVACTSAGAAAPNPAAPNPAAPNAAAPNPAARTAAPAAGSATAAATLPTYADYSAVDTAPNGSTSRITYGTVGRGNAKVDDCTVRTTGDPQAAVNAAVAGAVVCVAAGDYSSSTLTVDKAVTVRANGVVKIKNIVVRGSGAVVDGFNVVGGTLGNPNYAVKFSGTGHRIVNNLIRGRGIWYAIGCDQGAGCGSNVLIANNTITGVHNFGIYLWGGDRITVERNNVFDLFQSTNVDDVDALRAWGTNHVIRNNYFHDINARKSAGAPHSDCFQSYQSGGGVRPSSNILIENNYCVRVTGQCVILANDQRDAAELHDYVIRGNVCVTYGWQTIEITGVPNVTMDNDYVAGVQTTVLNFANGGGGGRVSSNYKVRNTVLVRATAGSRYVDGAPADNTANRAFVDPAVKASYDRFVGSTASYPPVTATDFGQTYRDSVGRAVPTVVDAGAPPNSGGPASDVDGGPRVRGVAVDVGPFELR